MLLKHKNKHDVRIKLLLNHIVRVGIPQATPPPKR
jgi:hypothetical protein